MMTTAVSLIDELEGALACGTNEKRLQTLWRITDLFIAGAERYSEEQINVFDEVIGKIAAVIENKARAKLASRLAPLSTAPLNVIRSLAFDDDIEVAHDVLSKRGVHFESKPALIAPMPTYDLWLAEFRDSENNVLALMCEKPK